jgi:hypothetical protein
LQNGKSGNQKEKNSFHRFLSGFAKGGQREPRSPAQTRSVRAAKRNTEILFIF